jgi:hypothetical protein
VSDALAIQIDRSELDVGETVTAQVQVLLDLPEAKELTGYAEATGVNLPAIRIGEIQLHEGGLTKGQSFSFSVTLPHDAPFSFEHDKHGLSWHVVADGDISWVTAEIAKAPLHVHPVRIEPSEEALALLAPSPPEPEQELGWVAKALFGALMIAVGICALPLAPFLLIYIANRRLERSRVTDFELTVPERHLALGEWIPLTIRFRLKRPVDVAALTIKLDGTKRWRSGDYSKSHCFHEESVMLLEDVVLASRPDASAGAKGGIYRRRAHATVDPGVFEVTVPMRLPPDGWPTVEGKITYTAAATLELRGWPDPSAQVKLPTFSALVEPVLDRPHALSVEEASPGIAIVAIGTTPPPGVDITVARDRIWPWVAIPTLGAAITVGSLAMAIEETNPPWLLLAPLAALGLAAVAYGLWGFYTRLYR